jgi:hypothetical protein
MPYSDDHTLVTFSRILYCNDKERVFLNLVYDTKEKEHQNTRQSDLYPGQRTREQIR